MNQFFDGMKLPLEFFGAMTSLVIFGIAAFFVGVAMYQIGKKLLP